MFDPSEFTEHRGTIRGSFYTYRRNGRGGVDVILTVDDDDKHTAIDLVDGGDIVVLIDVKGVPREERDWEEGD